MSMLRGGRPIPRVCAKTILHKNGLFKSFNRSENYSEWLGNSTAVAISNAYYPDNRTARDGISKLGMQIGIDAAANVLKEFYPDIEKLFRRKHRVE
jgi:hypothetical protein